MKVSEKMKATKMRAIHNQKYQVVRDEDGSWAVVTPRGFFRPCVSWSLAMGSVGRKRVTS